MSGSLHGLLIDAAERHPNRPALLWRDDALTYVELLARVEALAADWAGRGLQSGQAIALIQPRGLDAIACVYAASWLGCPYAPLDASWPIDRLLRTISALSPAAWVCPARLQGLFREEAPSWVPPKHALPEHVMTTGGAPAPFVGEGAPAYILFTSGSTGTPKGVVHSHFSALAFVRWAVEEVGVTAEDRLSGHAALSFDLSTFDVFAACAAGAALVPVPDSIRFRGTLLAQFIARYALTIVYTVPSAWPPILAANCPDSLKTLRAILFAGEVFPPADLRRLHAVAPQARLLNLYGPTETNVVTWHEVTERELSEEVMSPVIGRACPGTRLTVTPLHDGDPHAGELHVDGPTRMIGYFGQQPLQGPYATGDQVRVLPDTRLVFEGRLDGQIKVRGHRIETAEVEAACRQSAGVTGAAVIANEVDGVVVSLTAFVTPASVSPGSVLERCRARLPSAAVPEAVHCLECMPLTANGKVDRDRLRTRPPGS
jgi:amino acid adenylation domain-containing protein